MNVVAAAVTLISCWPCPYLVRTQQLKAWKWRKQGTSRNLLRGPIAALRGCESNGCGLSWDIGGGDLGYRARASNGAK